MVILTGFSFGQLQLEFTTKGTVTAIQLNYVIQVYLINFQLNIQIQ